MDYYLTEIYKWRKALDVNLRKENSWLSLAGLYWLGEGINTLGTDPDNHIVFPTGSSPSLIGSILVENDRASIRAAESVPITIDGEKIIEAELAADVTGAPTEVTLDNLTLILIKREDGLGIRLWDNDRPERDNFPGRQWYRIQENYCLDGSYSKFDAEHPLILQRKNGADFEAQVQGVVNFTLEGQDLTLFAFVQEDGELFIIFHDLTNGEETYSAGRYLVIDKPEDGRVIIDFNRAYNPPCAFTDYATCPLPPAENRLDILIAAGEKKPLAG